MMHDDIIEKLNLIFQEVFDDEELRVSPEMSAQDVAHWDSLSHVDMIVSVESAFGIRFSTREIGNLKNVGDLINCIAQKT